MGKLVLYDLLILWKSARAAFSRKRDLALLAAAALIGLLVAMQRAGAAAAALGALPILAKALMTAAAAYAINLGAARRLRHLRQESVVARHALRPAEAWLHGLLWNLVPLCGTVTLVLVSPNPLPAAAVTACAYVTGIGLAAAQRAVLERLSNWWAVRRAAGTLRRRELTGHTRRERIVQLLTARTGPAGPSVAANLLLFAAIGFLIGLGHGWLASQVEAAAAGSIAGLLALLTLLFLLRTHPPLLRYLLFLGSDPLLPALIPTGLAAAFVAGLLAGMMGSIAAPLLATLAAAATLLLLFLVAALLRTLHYATRSRHSAEIAFQIDLAAALIAGVLALPLAALVLIGRLFMLTRHARALRHHLP